MKWTLETEEAARLATTNIGDCGAGCSGPGRIGRMDMTVTAESITAESIIVEALASGMAKYAHIHFARALDAGIEPLLALELFLRERLSAADFRTALGYFNASTSASCTAFDEAVGHVPTGE